MLQKLKALFPNFFIQDIGTLTLDDMERAYHSAVEYDTKKEAELNEAVNIVNEALARYCEICHKGFTYPHYAKNHKRIKHKS